MKNFASDNHAGVPMEILHSLERANHEYALAYGDDSYTTAAIAKFKEQLGPDIEVYFVINGTSANVLGLKAITQSYQAILCAETAHINVDECGAPEFAVGCKLITVETDDGKLTPDLIKDKLHEVGNQHHNQPRVISISESSELGTVYTPAEIRSLADFAHRNGLLLHMDGARIANAAASLGCKLREITTDAGVDVLSFGGTKNGLMYGDAVVFLNRRLGADFKYIRKQGMQLLSKMRFLAVQFEALLTNDLWLKNAGHANEMARILAQEISNIPQIQITQKVEANAVFAVIPPQYIPKIQAKYLFGVWNEKTSEVRLMTSFCTTIEDIHDFIQVIKETIQTEEK